MRTPEFLPTIAPDGSEARDSAFGLSDVQFTQERSCTPSLQDSDFGLSDEDLRWPCSLTSAPDGLERSDAETMQLDALLLLRASQKRSVATCSDALGDEEAFTSRHHSLTTNPQEFEGRDSDFGVSSQHLDESLENHSAQSSAYKCH